MTIVEFLLARSAEDEADARIAAATEGWAWRAEDGSVIPVDHRYPSIVDWVHGAEHIARHDPARVLAECEAKRRIMELHAGDQPWDVHACPGRGPDDDEWVVYEAGQRVVEVYPCPTLRALAAVHADHPDYDPAWAS